MGVQQLVGLVAAGLPEELLVNPLDGGVLVALPDDLGLVLVVDSLGAEGPHILQHLYIGRYDGLAAAVYAAAGAGHNLDEVIARVALPYLLHELPGVGGTMCNGNLNIHTSHVDSGFLHTLNAPHIIVLNGLEILAGQDVRHGTESSRQDAAGSAEDYGSAGRIAIDLVEVLIGQQVELNASLLDHLAKLTGGQNSVDILIAAAIHLRPLNLVFLGGAGHDGYRINILRIDARLLSCLLYTSGAR